LLRQECKGVSPRFLERTLDEAYFLSKDDDFFRTKNEDEVVSKDYKKMTGKNHEDALTLMVPHLSSWKMDRTRFARQQGNDTTTSTSVHISSYIGEYTGMIDLPKPLA
jgi:hypothetical protein